MENTTETPQQSNTFFLENSENEIKRVFDVQKAYQLHGSPIPVPERKRNLLALRETMLKYNDEVKQALFDDMGRPTNEKMSFEINVTVNDIDYALANLDEWVKPVEVEPAENKEAKGYLYYEPRGVVLLLGAWNFPFSLITTPLVGVISAGNSVIIKPNNMTPASSRVMKAIVAEAFDEKHVAVFEGDDKMAEQLQKLPFDHVFLTGSPRVGKMVMAAASANLSSVTLELGGKNPGIVDDTIDLELSAKRIVESRMMNGGQTCLCIDYIAVPRERADELTSNIIKEIKKQYYDGDQYLPEKTSRMIDIKNFNRVVGYLEDAKKRGAKINFGGAYNAEKLIIEPAVFSNVPDDASILKEEIFGPFFVIIPYDEITDIYAYMNKLGKPLGMFIFAGDNDFVSDVLKNSSSGIVCINGWLEGWMDPTLPFGGVGMSGSGRYHGKHGFKELSHERAVYFNPLPK
jgi:aldehyde dehydrogenase (NAD+)